MTALNDARRSSRSPLLVISALSIGLAIHLRDGEYSRPALALITVALLSTTAFVAFPQCTQDSKLLAALGTALLLQFAVLFKTWPAGVDQVLRGTAEHAVFLLLLTVAAGLVAVGCLTSSGKLHRAWFPSLLGVFFCVGTWMVQASPQPRIDVWVFQQDASHELSQRRNPYAMTFPDIYHSTEPGHQPVYGPGLSRDGVLQFGFPYPPLSLLLAWLGYICSAVLAKGHLIAGPDHRYAQVAAMTLAGWFIGFARPGRAGKLAAALLLFTPRIFFIIGRAWTEPFVVMLLAATLYCACNKPAFLAICFGLLLACKQYMVLTIPISFLLLPQPWTWRRWAAFIAVGIAVSLLITAPFALWDWSAFYHSIVTVQEYSPFRWDALSYLVWLAWRDGNPNRLWLAPVALAPALLLAICRAERRLAGFFAATALILLTFFAFNKQAFCNYYLSVIASSCCAMASTRVTDQDGMRETN